MTDPAMWRGDLQRVLEWTTADGAFVTRVGERLDEDRRALLNAVIETRGDVRALAERLGPGLIQKLRARAPEAARERAARAWDLLGRPLATTWSAAADLSADQVAQKFLERYGTRLDELTGRGTKAAAAAKTASAAMQGVASSKDLLDAASGLESNLDELKAAGAACAHPEGAASWGDRAGTLALESLDSVGAARTLRKSAQSLRQRCEAIATALRAWAEAPAVDRAATAGSMAVHLRAAATVVTDMRAEIAKPPR